MLQLGCFTNSMVDPYRAVSVPQYLQKIRFVRMYPWGITKITWLFSPAWDTVELTLKAGLICPFMFYDPTNLGAIIVVKVSIGYPGILCPTIFNFRQVMQNTSL